MFKAVSSLAARVRWMITVGPDHPRIAGFVAAVRGPLARLLPPGGLAAVCWPGAAALAAFELATEGRTAGDYERLRALVGGRGRWNWRRVWLGRTRRHVAELARLWADAMPRPEWAARFRLVGSPAGAAALSPGGGPAVLLTLHHGPFRTLHDWLRGRGVRAAWLGGIDYAEVRNRPLRRALNAAADRATGMVGVPTLFTAPQLLSAGRFLADGGVLLVAASGNVGPPGCGRAAGVAWQFRPGGARLAGVAGAVVVPGVAVAGRGGVTTLWLGDPVRDESSALDALARLARDAAQDAPGQLDAFVMALASPDAGHPAVRR